MASAPRRVVKEVSGKVKYRKNSFIVEENEVFLYYTVSTIFKNDKFIEFVKKPPVLCDGILCHENKMYSVSVKELIKGIVNVSREYIQPTPTTSEGSVSGIPRDFKPELENVISYVDESGALEVSEVQVDKDADVAWSQHLVELLYVEDPEAEWEVLQDNPQTERSDESSTVQASYEAV